MKRTTSILAGMLVLLLVAAACGDDDGGSADDRQTREVDGLTITEDPNADPDDPAFLSIFVPEDLAGPVERLTNAFKEEDPDVLLQLTSGPRDQLQTRLEGDEAPHVYIDTPEELAQLDVEATGDPIELGEDPFRIAVARDNPQGVPGLEAFAAGDWTSGLCNQDVPCGELARSILAAAGVEPAPDLETDNGRALVSSVANGEIDAGLALRTDVRTRFFRTSTVELPAEYNITIEYEMLPIGSIDAIDRFVAFLESSGGDEALQQVGLRGFGGPAG